MNALPARRGASALVLVAVCLAAIVIPAGASPLSAPQVSQLEIANVTEYGFTVSWITNELAGGYLRYGTSDTSLGLQAYDSRGTGYVGYTHYVNINALVANQVYWFTATSGDTTTGSQSVRTGPSLGQPPEGGILAGTIRQSDGVAPAAGTIVHAYLQRGSARSAKQAALAGDDGRFQLDLALARTEDGGAFFSPVSTDSIRYQVNGGPQNLMPYDGPSGAQRFEMQAVLDGEELPDITLPNPSLPTATPARSPTPSRTRTGVPTTVASTPVPRSPTPTGTSSPSATPLRTATPQPTQTLAPTLTPVPPSRPGDATPSPPPMPPPAAPVPPTVAPVTTPVPAASATVQVTPTALLRPAAPVDQAARATRTALAAMLGDSATPVPPTPAPMFTAAALTMPPATEGGSWLPVSVRAIIVGATLLLAVGLGLVVMQVVAQMRGSGGAHRHW